MSNLNGKYAIVTGGGQCPTSALTETPSAKQAEGVYDQLRAVYINRDYCYP